MPEQVSDFYPTPSTLSTVMYYTGVDPRNMESVYVPRSFKEKAMQRALIQYRNPKNYDIVKEALELTHRVDLIGYAPKCLIRPERPEKFDRSKKNKKSKNKTITNDKLITKTYAKPKSKLKPKSKMYKKEKPTIESISTTKTYKNGKPKNNTKSMAKANAKPMTKSYKKGKSTEKPYTKEKSIAKPYTKRNQKPRR
jgi:hypothetical protein